jgi:hypothetical protein
MAETEVGIAYLDNYCYFVYLNKSKRQAYA